MRFKDIDLDDHFFDSLKRSYKEFSEWFRRKGEESAYVVFRDDGTICGLLYMKIESGPVVDISPTLIVASCLKVGTFKIDAHGTRLGERFVKIIVDAVLHNGLRHAYVTVFKEHEHLVSILEKYGFALYGDKKNTERDRACLC